MHAKMEVRSTEKCETAAPATAATATDAIETAKPNNLIDFKSSAADSKRAAGNMDLSRTTVNDETRPPLTRDESEYKFSLLLFFSFKKNYFVTFLYVCTFAHLMVPENTRAQYSNKIGKPIFIENVPQMVLSYFLTKQKHNACVSPCGNFQSLWLN